MKSFALAALASTAAAISNVELEFTKYVARFNKIYEDVEEFAARLERFTYHHRLISEHNATKANFTLGTNQFTDWTEAEYEAIQGYIPKKDDENDKSRS